jgi:hypothetical protein
MNKNKASAAIAILKAGRKRLERSMRKIKYPIAAAKERKKAIANG